MHSSIYEYIYVCAMFVTVCSLGTVIVAAIAAAVVVLGSIRNLDFSRVQVPNW